MHLLSLFLNVGKYVSGPFLGLSTCCYVLKSESYRVGTKPVASNPFIVRGDKMIYVTPGFGVAF